ncbi:SDR family NAD(P)-dependent oxidoreductase [Shimia sagamensis]|uniref:NAD(P)-dependent dehydrogenase, short-chain alcohol dehydrogenase family n=1 Tax=Shimia sagamensis TaxID=1566352 RepID=A0ABY1NN39_9RHOB|nr:SDR family oxidoreductase [Shimia sagamensis]SMP13974.1 NAD(P)-dependent dehydrogenase, short-chain alcohol dehydrogenase family [Shimia sagamensis]
MENFENKVVLVTGGGSGIGKATAAAFVASGAKVVITGRRKAVLEKTAQELGSQVHFIAADVCETGEPARIVEETIGKFGRLDVLVNNAGTGTMGPLSATSDTDIESTYRINVFAPLAFVREAIPHLATTKGAVVNISSVTARGTLPAVVAYASSKAAGEHAVRLLAAELGPMGIRVNAVAPGFTDTDALAYVKSNEEMMGMIVAQTPMGRLGKPEDIASAVLMLAGDRAAWVTGQSVQAGGGYML